MSFQILLQQLMHKVPGALGAILADWEGEPVDQAARIDHYHLQVFGAHKGIVLANLRTVIKRFEENHLRELVIVAETCKTVVLPVTEDYFLLLLLEREALLGRALAEARRCMRVLYAEIA